MPPAVRSIALAVALLWAGGAHAQAQDETAIRARIAQVQGLIPTVPDPSLTYLLALDYARLGDKAKALEWLERAADTRAGFDPRDPAFAKLEGEPGYQRLRARMDAERAPVLRGRTAFVISEPGLVPEGVAWDPASRRLFLGDMHGRRILAVEPSGRVRTFARDLRLRPLGMKVDPERGRLWVATTDSFLNTAKKQGELVAFDLASGRVVARHTHPEAVFFNDLAIAPDGAIYLTDSEGGTIYRLPADGSAMQRVTQKGAMGYPNGIAWLNGRLYVAQGIALRRVDPATGEIVRVRGLPGYPGLGIDGLYAHDGALIGVQGAGFKGRVARFELSPEGDAVTGVRVLETDNPVFDEPTPAAPAGDRLYVLANAQLARLRPDGTVDDPKTLKPIVILELPLG